MRNVGLPLTVHDHHGPSLPLPLNCCKLLFYLYESFIGNDSSACSMPKGNPSPIASVHPYQGTEAVH
jgi:hypothetical protein